MAARVSTVSGNEKRSLPMTTQERDAVPTLSADAPTASFDVSSLVKAWSGKDHTVVLLKTDSLRVVFRSLGEGNTLPPHKAAGDITVLVLEGQIEFTATDQRMSLEKGQVVALKAAVPHSVKALRHSAILISLAAGQGS